MSLDADLDNIAYVFANPPDFKTGKSRGYTVGRIVARLPGGKVKINRENVADDVGEKIAAVMKKRGEAEYGGHLVTPSGDPLTEVMKTAERVDISGVEDRVVKKKL